MSILRLRDILPEYMTVTRALSRFITPALMPGYRQYSAFINELYDVIVADIDMYKVRKMSVSKKKLREFYCEETEI